MWLNQQHVYWSWDSGSAGLQCCSHGNHDPCDMYYSHYDLQLPSNVRQECMYCSHRNHEPLGHVYPHYRWWPAVHVYNSGPTLASCLEYQEARGACEVVLNQKPLRHIISFTGVMQPCICVVVHVIKIINP